MLGINYLSNRLLFTTTRIVATLSDGTQSVGTAFFFRYAVDEQTHVPVLITNKHVVKDAKEGTFFMHEAFTDNDGQIKPSQSSICIKLHEFENAWIGHPDPNIDMCVMPLGSLHEQVHAMGKQFFYQSLDESIVPTQDQIESITALEEVIMVGYPIGLWDDINNFPILRRGITASHPATNFQGKPQGVVDIAAFPGSSGSPIFILNEGTFRTPTGISLGNRLLFLGVLFAGPQHMIDGSIEIIEIPTRQVPISITMIPVHLGFYIKSGEIIKLKDFLFTTWNVKASAT